MTKTESDRCPYSERGYCLEQEKRCSEVQDCKTWRRLLTTRKAIRQEAPCTEAQSSQ